MAPHVHSTPSARQAAVPRRRILLCYDGSAEAKHALERVGEIAAVVPSRVTVVSVAPALRLGQRRGRRRGAVRRAGRALSGGALRWLVPVEDPLAELQGEQVGRDDRRDHIERVRERRERPREADRDDAVTTATWQRPRRRCELFCRR
jgi:Universal stress protein family